MSGIPGILLMTGTHNVLWTLECLGSSSGKRKKKRKKVDLEKRLRSQERWGGGQIRCGDVVPWSKTLLSLYQPHIVGVLHRNGYMQKT